MDMSPEAPSNRVLNSQTLSEFRHQLTSNGSRPLPEWFVRYAYGLTLEHTVEEMLEAKAACDSQQQEIQERFAGQLLETLPEDLLTGLVSLVDFSGRVANVMYTAKPAN